MPMPGQPAPAMAPAPANVGPVAAPQGNTGNMVQALSLVRNGLEAFQKALPMIPMGAPLHTDLLKTISSVSKHMEPGEGNKGTDLATLLQQARTASQQSPVQAVNRMFPAPTAAPAMPAAPPKVA